MNRIARITLIGIACLVMTAVARAGDAPEPLATFSVRELFGVSHPDQVIDFDLNREVDPAGVRMIGPDGKEVLFQLIEGGKKIAVRTDLAAGAEKTWKLAKGQPAAGGGADAVKVQERDGLAEIENGLTGVRVPLTAPDLNAPPAPVQGVKLRDGVWTAAGPNKITLNGVAKKMEVRYLEKGPLKVVLEISYQVVRNELCSHGGKVARVDVAANALVLAPEHYLGCFNVPGKPIRFFFDPNTLSTFPKPLQTDKTYYAIEVGGDVIRVSETPGGPPLKLEGSVSGAPQVHGYIAPGPATYKTTITVEAGQPSVLFEEEGDVQANYAFLLKGVKLDQARYRGHHSTQKAHGYEADGQQYRMQHARPELDAFFDLRFDRNYMSSNTTDLGGEPRIRRMAVWDPWITDSGWYWQAYDKSGGPASNLVGLFSGRVSRALMPGNSGTGFWTLSGASGGPAVGVAVALELSQPPNVYPHIRFQWGLFAGVKGTDLAEPAKPQGVGRQMNLHGGFNLNKIHRLKLVFPDPVKGYGSMYMSKEAVSKIAERARSDEAYRSYLYSAEPSAKALIDVWCDKSGAKIGEVCKGIDELSGWLTNSFVHGDGIYNQHLIYWMGGLRMIGKLLWIDQVLGSDQATKEQKAKARATAVLFASVLWDNDYVPLDNYIGFNLGTANMPVQQQSFRQMYALLLASHPMMKDRIQELEKTARGMLQGSINEHGAHMGSTHYVGAANGPLLTTLQQLKMAGVWDAYKAEPCLAKFGEFYMNALTPAEARFSGKRKLIVFGDGYYQGTTEFGMLGTAFADINPELSARLMGAWQEEGKPHSGSEGGTTLLMIDENLPAKSPNLGHANFPGYFSVLRYGWGTPKESAIWFLNGDWYRDHRHIDDGAVSIFALNTPLSLDWASCYEPGVGGAYMHSVVVPESIIGSWDKEHDFGAGGNYPANAKCEAFAAFANSGYSQGSHDIGGLHWTRAVTLLHANADYPVYSIEDRFSGAGADQPKISTLTLMADGDVSIPGGKVTPPPHKQLASVGQIFPLNPGINRLGFTGQQFGTAAKPTPAIDWDLFVVTKEPKQARVGQWGFTWQAGEAAGDFKAANGRDFSEHQHILRVRGTGAFKTLILPYRKGAKREVNVTENNGGIAIVAGDETTVVTPEYYTFKNPAKTALGVFGDTAASANGISAEGGPVEVVVEADQVTITAHGKQGVRTLTMPGDWKASAPLTRNGAKWTLSYPGGEPLKIVLQK